ncbi:MAG TPA: hypothetical protein VMV43_00480 [Candidatus Nanopelagicaceae bacterium]|nr:hypothetical protein [Candidatus Nanopelagicaceae bacterium]
MAEIENILSRLEIIFKATKLKYVIVGGIAVIHYGHVRATQDIDIIIEDDYSKISQFIGLLKAYKFDVLDDQFKLAYQEKTNISIFDKNSFLRLDIKVADKKHEHEVLNHAKKEKILGKDLFIAPLEYVLIGKLIYMGLIDDIPHSELLEYQDAVDFLTLFHANKKTIDLAFLSNKAKQIGLKTTLDKLFSIDI